MQGIVLRRNQIEPDIIGHAFCHLFGKAPHQTQPFCPKFLKLVQDVAIGGYGDIDNASGNGITMAVGIENHWAKCAIIRRSGLLGEGNDFFGTVMEMQHDGARQFG